MRNTASSVNTEHDNGIQKQTNTGESTTSTSRKGCWKKNRYPDRWICFSLSKRSDCMTGSVIGFLVGLSLGMLAGFCVGFALGGDTE